MGTRLLQLNGNSWTIHTIWPYITDLKGTKRIFKIQSQSPIEIREAALSQDENFIAIVSYKQELSIV